MQINYYKFVIPYSPESINKVVVYGKNVFDIVQVKHKWQKRASVILDQAIADGTLPDRFKGRIGIMFKMYFATEKERDGDNYAVMCKGVIDAMVRKQMIPDDNFKFIDDDGRRFRIDTERPRIELYIKEKISGNKLVTIQEYANENPSQSVLRRDPEISSPAVAS